MWRSVLAADQRSLAKAATREARSHVQDIVPSTVVAQDPIDAPTLNGAGFTSIRVP